MRCLNQDIFVSSIALKVIRERDNSTHNFEWGAFRSQKLTHKGEEAEIELPYGLRLSQIYKTYDWVYNNGYNNIGKWIDEAVKQAGS